jgi:hypothetical protein
MQSLVANRDEDHKIGSPSSRGLTYCEQRRFEEKREVPEGYCDQKTACSTTAVNESREMIENNPIAKRRRERAGRGERRLLQQQPRKETLESRDLAHQMSNNDGDMDEAEYVPPQEHGGTQTTSEKRGAKAVKAMVAWRSRRWRWR